MTDNGAGLLTDPHCVPWNKGKLIGAKPPLRPKAKTAPASSSWRPKVTRRRRIAAACGGRAGCAFADRCASERDRGGNTA